MDRPGADVIVVGGGFAGLSAATDLAARGMRVLLLEARPGLGGRASAFTDPGTGERVDNGQHVLIGGYRETFRFLRRIGAADRVFLQPALAVDFIDADGRASRLRCPRVPAPFHLLGGLLGWEALDWRDRMAALALSRRLHLDPAHGMGTVREWLLASGQTPRLITLLWEPLAVAGLNESIDTASAVLFAAALRRMFGGRARDAALGLPRVPMDELYAAPAMQFVESHGGRVRLNAPARIPAAHAGAVSVRGERLTARALIAAVPWHALPGLFDNGCPALQPVLDAAAATPPSPIVTVNLWLDRPVTDHPFVGLPGRTLQWLFDKRQIFGTSSSHLSLVGSAAGAVVELPNPDLIELAVNEARAALPRARDAAVRRAVVVRERRATFSVAPSMPPRPATRTPVAGLFLAGDWIATGLPATIEGAVASGHLAAAAAAEYLAR